MIDAIKKLKGLESGGLAHAALSEIGKVLDLKSCTKTAKIIRRNVAKAYETGFQRGWECALDRVTDLVKRDSKHVRTP